MKSAARVERDCALSCEKPQRVELDARPWWVGPDRRIASGSSRVLILDLWVPCRKCGPCLAARGREWTRRALAELQTSVRTWFGTLTLDPHYHSIAMMRARRKHPNWHELSDSKQFGALVREISRQLTLFIKRVRKRSKAPVRYILVAEKHSKKLAGLPHFHLLIHELDADKPVRKKVLKKSWHLGHTHFILAVEENARYVCKYLAKEAATRVRASKDYGRVDDRSAVDLLRGRLGLVPNRGMVVEKPTNDL